MADQELLDKVQDLSDLELAALICLVAQEHCIIDTDEKSIDELVQELELVAAEVFGLSHAVIDCSEHTTPDSFAQAILSVESSPTQLESSTKSRQDSYFLNTPVYQSTPRSPLSDSFRDNYAIANVIIAKNLNRAHRQVQIQALELMRTKRIYTRTSVQNAPKRFLFIALLAGRNTSRLTKHLNDYMFISHFHDPEEGYPNLEDLYDDRNSTSSVVKKNTKPDAESSPRISVDDIDQLMRASDLATVSVEVKQYQQNIISFLRLHRAVAGGVSAVATKHFDKLARCLAALHGLAYTTPSLIALAARRIYRHRIDIVKPENERSMQWGSDLEAIEALLRGVTADDVIEEVITRSGNEVPI